MRGAPEIAVGLLYAAGALFNAAHTTSHGASFYGSFVDGAWLGPARWLMREVVVPNGTGFTVVLIVFQVAVAAAILSRGPFVTVAFLAGAAFCVVAALVSSPGGTVANLALAVIQLWLALAVIQLWLAMG